MQGDVFVLRLYPPPPTAYRVPPYFARRTAYRVKFYWRNKYYHGVQRRMFSVDNIFVFFEIIIFCFVVAIYVLVHDVETIFHLSYLLTASGNLF